MLGAARSVARGELRRRLGAIAAAGVVAGLAGAATAGTLAVTIRTLTAPDRLEAAVHVEDARVTSYANDVARRVAALPAVRRSWVAGLGVGRVRGPGLAYISMLAGPERPPGLFTPVVVEGRAPDPARADEVVLAEHAARAGDVHPGATLELGMLAPDQLGAFSAGPIDPTGPVLRVRVVGVVRLTALPANDQSPLIGTPALYAAHPEAFGVATTAFLDLRNDPKAVAEVRAYAASISPPPAPDVVVPPVLVSVRADARAPVVPAIRTLRVGLLTTVVLLLVAWLLAVVQAMARQATSSRAEHRIEAAVGLTGHDRAAARALAAVPAAAVAAALTATGVLAAGLVPALGPSRGLEPHPGWAPNLGLAAASTVVVAAFVVTAAYVVTRAAGAAPADPAVAAGAGASTPPWVRAATVAAVAGVVAAASFGASLHRLATDPARWGWNADVEVLDITGPVLQRLTASDAVAGVGVVRASEIDVAGQPTSVYALQPAKGSVTWTILSGRAPAAPDEVALGPRLARRLDRRTGDHVVIGGTTRRVTGIAIGPTLQGERLGSSLLAAPAAFEALADVAPSTDALVRWAPGGARVAGKLIGDVETAPPRRPADVEHVAALGRLPDAVGIVLAVLFVAVYVHGLATTNRRRAGDIAVMRVVGFTSGRAARSVVMAGAAVAAAGVVVGVPVGLGIARLLWWVLAHDAGAATDLAVPWRVLGLVMAGVPLVSAALALPPARRVSRRRLAPILRAE